MTSFPLSADVYQIEYKSHIVLQNRLFRSDQVSLLLLTNAFTLHVLVAKVPIRVYPLLLSTESKNSDEGIKLHGTWVQDSCRTRL